MKRETNKSWALKCRKEKEQTARKEKGKKEKKNDRKVKEIEVKDKEKKQISRKYEVVVRMSMRYGMTYFSEKLNQIASNIIWNKSKKNIKPKLHN